MSKGERPRAPGQSLQKPVCGTLDPPGRGDFWILKIAHAPSPKSLSKNGLSQKGVAFLWKAFLQKNFQVREKIPLSALAVGCSHALVAEAWLTPRLVHPHRLA
jgi:hypothetical protein